MTQPWYWINTSDALDEACAQLAQCDVIGVDTEFLRETTFAPIPALIQLSSGECAWLIDPMAVAPTDALRTLLGPEGPVKLLHACSEDLEVFQLWLKDIPRPIIDTQVAEGFCGGETSIGYKRLVEKYLGEDIPKDATRSDWTKRPLTETQCRYAALDVQYLPAVWAMQHQALTQSHRLGWVEENCCCLIDAARQPSDYSQYYLRHRQAWRLDARRLAVLAQLCEWREIEIRRRNIPRGHLVNDGQLLTICERLPKNIYALSDIQGLRPTFIKRDGERVLALIQRALAMLESEWPSPLPSPQAPSWKAALKPLRAAIEALAKRIDLAPELLMRRREREEWVTQWLRGERPALPTDWRAPLLAPVWDEVFPIASLSEDS